MLTLELTVCNKWGSLRLSLAGGIVGQMRELPDQLSIADQPEYSDLFDLEVDPGELFPLGEEHNE